MIIRNTIWLLTTSKSLWTVRFSSEYRTLYPPWTVYFHSVNFHPVHVRDTKNAISVSTISKKTIWTSESNLFDLLLLNELGFLRSILYNHGVGVKVDVPKLVKCTVFHENRTSRNDLLVVESQIEFLIIISTSTLNVKKYFYVIVCKNYC